MRSPPEMARDSVEGELVWFPCFPLHPVPNSKRALSWKAVPYWSGCCCGCFFRGAGLDRE